MITLKVLNSIVLLGTSCIFVKEANMEEKLFDPPPSAVSSRVNSRANRTKIVHAAPQKGREELKWLHIPKDVWTPSLIVPRCLSAEATSEEGGLPDNAQAANLVQSAVSALPKSDSDTFLTTPDEDEEKIIIVNAAQDGDGLEPRRPKKDLLEIDRFTICGNRID